MIKLAKTRKRSAILEMTPLVDVVFLLLVFFLLTSTSIQRSLDIDLPETESGAVQTVQPVMVSILPDGSIRIDSDAVALADLLATLQLRLADASRPALTIETDQRVPFGLFARVLDLAKQAGAEEISLATEILYSGDRK